MAAGERNKKNKPTDIVRHYGIIDGNKPTICKNNRAGYITSDKSDVTCLKCLQILNYMSKNITVMSSHGEITINGETGEIIKKVLYNKNQPDLKDISRFDVAEYRQKYGKSSAAEMPNQIDILDLGYWVSSGTYVEPEHEWREEFRTQKS